MNFMDELEAKLTAFEFKVINTYKALPQFMRDSRVLFDHTRQEERAIHYSQEVKDEIQSILAIAIKLDLQQKWMEQNDPWCYEDNFEYN